ncbi:hypothetical protein [Arthrobacter sp. BE255]|uniref:hypothetical protein n=1 Tax=Arthrobacter sp. BE255 TaxID=2817721 RepID=UPI002856A108|nr:hypothetical protein [Arthrobacter sp. BE255]MDR7158121.1 hypothetical protein [Arthrobacter sp. BE255]
MLEQGIRYDVMVRISQRKELEDELDRAVEGAIQEALKNPGCGVLVTRHDHQTFTVELSREVPQGMISEKALYALA